MTTVGVLMSNAYVDYSSHLIRGLCLRAKEQGNVNLIFFPGILGSDFVSRGREDGQYDEAVSLADVFIISDQEMLHMLLEQPEHSIFSNILEHTPYVHRSCSNDETLDHSGAVPQAPSPDA